MDHVILTKECERLRLRVVWHHSFSNIVLACSGCNAFDNGYKVLWQRPRTADARTEDEFTALRDRVFRVFEGEEGTYSRTARRCRSVLQAEDSVGIAPSLDWVDS